MIVFYCTKSSVVVETQAAVFSIMISVISQDKRPVRIPPEYVQYAEKHSIFRLAQVGTLLVKYQSVPLDITESTHHR